MSRIITISVNLDDEDADQQLMMGAATLQGAAGNEAEIVITEPKKPACAPPKPPAASTAGEPPKPPAEDAPVDNGSEDTILAEDERASAPDEEQAPPPVTVDLDDAGLPWDGRIHAASKTKLVKGGTWKLKRGVDADLVTQVTEQLKATMAAAPVSTSAAEAFESSPHTMSFPEFMNTVTPRMAVGAEKPLTQAQVDAVLIKHGIPSLPMLASRPDFIPAIAAELEAL